MSDHNISKRERLAAEVRSRLQADLPPHTRELFERAQTLLPDGSELYLATLEEMLAMAPERLERQLANLHRARSMHEGVIG
jgi:DNA-binding transcriptional regulator YbjK